MKKTSSFRIETQAVHGTAGVDPMTGAINQPLYLSTTFERDPDGNYSKGYSYSRSGNPNRQALEQTLAVLEEGQRAFCFASGLAAMSAMLQTMKTGDHIIIPRDMYYGARNLVKTLWQRWGLEHSVVDFCNIENLKQAIQPNTRMIWMETPSNPLLTLVDLKAVAEVAKNIGAITVCDNTLGTPVLQKPLSLGIDVVMHSTTKFINGHSDVMGGVLVFAEDNEWTLKAEEIQAEGGAVPAPFDCMMILRGLQTLPLRMRQQCETAMSLCQYLQQQPAIESVHYPGLTCHPQHDLARSQMQAYGAVASFQIKGNQKDTFAMMSQLRLILQATSLGGTHTKIEHRYSVEGEGSQAPENLLRISFGIENAEDLKEDLDRALATLKI